MSRGYAAAQNLRIFRLVNKVNTRPGCRAVQFAWNVHNEQQLAEFGGVYTAG
jgi:hypothetical protein